MHSYSTRQRKVLLSYLSQHPDELFVPPQMRGRQGDEQKREKQDHTAEHRHLPFGNRISSQVCPCRRAAMQEDAGRGRGSPLCKFPARRHIFLRRKEGRGRIPRPTAALMKNPHPFCRKTSKQNFLRRRIFLRRKKGRGVLLRLNGRCARRIFNAHILQGSFLQGIRSALPPFSLLPRFPLGSSFRQRE